MPSQNTPSNQAGKPTVPDAAPDSTAPEGAAALVPSTSPQPKEASAASEKKAAENAGAIRTNVERVDGDLQGLISKMLTEGSTFEDVVEAVNERGGQCITLNDVQSYFQGNLELQAKRVHHLVNSADALLAEAGKNPKSAEARLARATFLTGYLRVRRDASLISPKDAEHFRLERENVSLKRRLLVMQKEKAQQQLKYSNARTHWMLLSQEKLREEILKLQQEAKAHRAGEPMGPEILQRIQQLYGLASQPLLCEGSVNVSAKA